MPSRAPLRQLSPEALFFFFDITPSVLNTFFADYFHISFS
jgi:hypothetical protein